MKKKTSAIVLSLLLCIALLAGCGDKTDPAASAPAGDAPAQAASAPEAAPAEESAEETGTALTAEQTEYWVGDWYGVWTIEGCGGTMAEHNWPGMWDDVVGRSTLNGDGTITLKLWGGALWDFEKPMAELTLSLSAPEADKPLGVATSVSGTSDYYSWPEPAKEIPAGDWVLDPAGTDYERLICMRAVYYDATQDDYLDYSLLLRPWGMLWDDICPDGNNQKDANGTLGTYYSRPMQYEQVYVPMVENNYPLSNICIDLGNALRTPVDGVYASKTFDYHGYSVTYPLGFFTAEGVNLEDLVKTDWAFGNTAVTKVYFRDIGTAENLQEHYATKADYATRSDVSGYETWDSEIGGYTVHNYVYELQGWGWYYEAYIDYGGDIGTAAIQQSSYAAYIYFISSERDNVYNDITQMMVNSFVFHG